MTPEQVALVQRSMRVLTVRSDELAHRFFARLFELDPAVRPMFPADMAGQRGKFVAELSAIVDAISDLEQFVARGAELGRLHHRLGVRSVHYRLGGDALADTISAMSIDTDLAAIGSPELGSPEMHDAWRSAYRLASDVMLGGGTDDPGAVTAPGIRTSRRAVRR